MSVAFDVAPAQTKPISLALRVRLFRAARAEQLRRSLYEFVKASWSVLEPGVEFEDNWHIKVFCDHVQWMLEGWLLANGYADPSIERWRIMIERQREFWAMHGLEMQAGQLLVQNLVMNLPPITLKSRILMVCAPAWVWTLAPTFKLCAISSVNDNVKRDSNAHRDLVQSPWYRETFAISWTIRKTTDAVSDWQTTAGGERKSRTTFESFTGVHSDGIFLDDPDDAHKVFSEAIRKGVQYAWTRSIKNRVKHPDRSIRIAIQQRVHLDDWTAAQVEKSVWSPEDRRAWAWVVVPLEFGRGPEEAPACSPWGWIESRTAANDNLQPSRFSPEFIADEKRDRGPDGFEAIYNQNPRSMDDGMIKRSYVRYFRVEDDPIVEKSRRPYGTGLDLEGNDTESYIIKRREDGLLDVDWCVLSVDASNGGELLTSSDVGLLVIAGIGARRFCLEDMTKVMGIEETYEAVATLVELYPEISHVQIEKKAAGPSVINDLSKRIADGITRVVVIEAITPMPGDSKESRAAAMVSSWAAGLCHLREGAAWLYPTIVGGGRVVDEGHVAQICTFPKSKKNDRVDCWSQTMSHFGQQTDTSARWKALIKARGAHAS